MKVYNFSLFRMTHNYECPKVLLNVDLNAKIVIEFDLCPNVPMYVSLHNWWPFHANDCVFSRNEQQKVYYPQKVCNFHMQVFQIRLKYHCSKPIKL